MCVRIQVGSDFSNLLFGVPDRDSVEDMCHTLATEAEESSCVELPPCDHAWSKQTMNEHKMYKPSTRFCCSVRRMKWSVMAKSTNGWTFTDVIEPY